MPFALGFGLFNARFFGSPFTLGYVAASGPNHGLGFHEDPWGRLYTPIQAVGYSSAELVSLGRELLGGPVPLAAVIGVFLLVAPRLERGVRVIAAWALLPLLASALYWHHDLVFGPRMLGEAAPAWTALAVIATAGLIARVAPDRGGRGARWAGDALALAAVFVLGYGLAVGAPGRLARFTGRLGARPHVEASNAPTLAFVHEPWADRLGGRLAGRGMRLDSIRTVLTRFHPCQVEAGLDGIPPSRAGPVCEREQAADRLPSLGITSLLWMGDLPGLPAEGVMWARDLGPERNLALIGLHPGRVPKVLLPPPAAGGEWRLVPYEEGMSAIWPPAPD